MTLFLIRHGETTGDIEDRYGGDYDDSLTARGEQQARDLAEELASRGITAIVSSSLIRARQTADMIAHDIPITIEPDFKERNQYGILTGKVRSEARNEYPELAEQVKDRLNTIDGAESYDDFLKRVSAAFDRLEKNAKNVCIAVITHAGPIRVIFRDVLKKGELGTIGDCAWMQLEKQGNQLAIIDSRGIEFLFKGSSPIRWGRAPYLLDNGMQ